MIAGRPSAAAAARWWSRPASARSRRAASSRPSCARSRRRARPAGLRPERQRDRRRRARGRRSGATRSAPLEPGPGGDDLPERQRRRSTRSARAAGSAATPSSRPATRRSLDASDWLAALGERDGVRSVALFLESDGDGAKLAEALARCAERGVGVAVLKVGSSEAGARAAAAHTGALAGDQRVFRALVEEAGAAWAERPARAAGARRALAEPRARPRGDGGLAVLTCSGGDSGVAADEAERLGIELPPLAPATARAARGAAAADAATIGNPLDYTAMIWGETDAAAPRSSTAVGDDPAIDQLLISTTIPEGLAPRPRLPGRAVREGLVARRRRHRGGHARRLHPARPDRRRARRSSSPSAACRRSPACARRCSAPARCAAPPADPARLRAIAAAARAPAVPTPGDGGWLGEAEAKELLRGAGVAGARGRRGRRAPTSASGRARGIGWPVALKLSLPRAPPQERGGRARARDRRRGRAAAAYARLRSVAAGRRRAGSWSSGWPRPGVELLIAARADAVVPALVVGLGGIWTEALDDVAIVPLPADARAGRARRCARCAARRCSPAGAAASRSPSTPRPSSPRERAMLLLERGLALLELNPVVVAPGGLRSRGRRARPSQTGLARPPLR